LQSAVGRYETHRSICISVENQIPRVAKAERVRFSGEPSTFDVGETDAASAQALLEHAILFLEVVDHIQLMAIDLDNTGKSGFHEVSQRSP
jgi:hypothetical protein